jgi:hypothetical protein
MTGPNVAGYQYQGNRTIPDPDLVAVTVMTAGTLVQMFRADENLSEAAMVMLDEVHEMSPEIEILLGCLHEVSCPLRSFKICAEIPGSQEAARTQASSHVGDWRRDILHELLPRFQTPRDSTRR